MQIIRYTFKFWPYFKQVFDMIFVLTTIMSFGDLDLPVLVTGKLCFFNLLGFAIKLFKIL